MQSFDKDNLSWLFAALTKRLNELVEQWHTLRKLHIAKKQATSNKDYKQKGGKSKHVRGPRSSLYVRPGASDEGNAISLKHMADNSALEREDGSCVDLRGEQVAFADAARSDTGVPAARVANPRRNTALELFVAARDQNAAVIASPFNLRVKSVLRWVCLWWGSVVALL